MSMSVWLVVKQRAAAFFILFALLFLHNSNSQSNWQSPLPIVRCHSVGCHPTFFLFRLLLRLGGGYLFLLPRNFIPVVSSFVAFLRQLSALSFFLLFQVDSIHRSSMSIVRNAIPLHLVPAWSFFT